MADTSLAKKLVIKPNYRILLINAPEGYREHMGELPEGVTVTTQGDGPFDMVQAFAQQRTELEDVAPEAIRAVKPDGLLWFTYPKKTGNIASDLSRDVTWQVITPLGWRPVTQISIDDTWSALRFRPGEMNS
jgi:hypothetical protein